MARTGSTEENATYYETLQRCYYSPIDLNKESIDAIAALQILSLQQLEAIKSYRDTYGPLANLYELQAIEGFDEEVIKLLQPFVTVSNYVNKKLKERIFPSQGNYIVTDYSQVLETRSGFSDNKYIGSPNKLKLRSKFGTPGDISFGFIAEKDPGEKYLYSINGIHQPDFSSAFVSIENKGFLKKMIIGDYQFQIGQGLVLGSGFRVSKSSSSAGSIQQANFGLSPYTSVTEYKYLRGTACTLQLSNRFQFSSFYSNKNIDATLEENGDGNMVAKSLLTTGLHRTQSEINRRQVLNKQSAGASFQYQGIGKKLNLGLTYLGTQLEYPAEPKFNTNNLYKFYGQINHVVGLNSNFRRQNFSMFADVSRSESSGLAYITGAVVAISDKVDIGIMHRNYQANFHSFYASSFGESSEANNEQGTYWSLSLRPAHKIRISAYYDIFKSHWLKTYQVAPTVGNEYLVKVLLQISKTDFVTAQIRGRNKGVSIFNDTLNYSKHTSTLQLYSNFEVAKNISIKTRVQLKIETEDKNKQHGVLINQDAKYKHRRFSVMGRFGIFDTGNSSLRLYCYENDVLYSFYTPSFSGRGTRKFILVSYKATRSLSFRIKAMQTRYNDREVIGSGLDTIEGNKINQVTFQSKLVF